MLLRTPAILRTAEMWNELDTFNVANHADLMCGSLIDKVVLLLLAGIAAVSVYLFPLQYSG